MPDAVRAFVGNFKGPKGEQGPQGIQGPTGPQGLQGPAGPSNADGIDTVDTLGVLVSAGESTDLQRLIDAIADKVMTKLLAKTDIVQTESTATNKVPSSAYLKQVKDSIDSNLADKLLIKNTTLWSGKNYADDYRAESMIFYCNPVQGNLTAYNFPVNETGVFKSIVCNQFVSQTYITINNALYQRIAADSSSPFSAWELK